MTVADAKQRAWSLAGTLRPESGLLAEDIEFYGPLPIGRLRGRGSFEGTMLRPLRRSMPNARKRPYLYFGGYHQGMLWIGTTGNIEGEMIRPWLGIPAGSGPRKLRFGEFYRFECGQVTEIRCLLDIPGLAAQAGIDMFPPFAGKAHIPDGPPTEIGLVASPQPRRESERTLKLVSDMIRGGCNRLVGSDLASQSLDGFWHPDMAWHGPWGVGSSYGLDEFYAFAQGPSVQAFPGRKGSWPKHAFIAEGVVAGFVGWPGFLGEFRGKPFRGIEPTGKPITKNVMDFYVRRGDCLAENWVLIDLIDFARQCGVDLLAPLRDPAEACATGS